MSNLSNPEIITAIQNADEGILFYITDRYFHVSRKLLNRQGCRDSDTPGVFSRVLLRVYREIQLAGPARHIDFEKYFFNSLKEEIPQIKLSAGENTAGDQENIEIITSCYSILDDQSKLLITDRYLNKLTFEQIAVRRNFSNPVIAEFEFEKALLQFENIVKARLNLSDPIS